MKRTRIVLAWLLVWSLILSLTVFSTAEVQVDEDWQADILKLMDERDVPETYTVTGDAATEGKEHVYLCEKVNAEGTALCVKVRMTAEKADWKAIDEWIEATVSGAIQGIAVDAKSLATVSANAIADARAAYAPEPDAETPAWADEGWTLTEVSATVPYYPELKNGVNGTATQRLQEKLIVLGFLDDKADGFFGGMTEKAVKRLQNYVRSLEQDVIDALPTASPTPEVTAEPTLSPDDTPVVIDTPVGEETVEPTVEPDPTPATEVNGVADALLQAYLYSSAFVTTRGELKNGDAGDEVARLQNRLRRLGCMAEDADGNFGGSTARSIRIFQYYNGLEQTGIADVETQRLLFSESAKAPDNSLLSSGSSGEDVKKLQLRLRVLGFMNASVDGDFGSGTVQGVKTLQQYMRDLEEQRVRADETAMAQLGEEGDITSLLTVEVNGIADPMLLDDFYADEFPAIPAPMSKGDNGIDVVRVQRRLRCLEYYFGSLDGDFGSGTEKAINTFQKQNKLERTGEADAATLALLFSEDAKKAMKPYVLKVSIDDQRVYAYALDSDNEYTDLVRTMKCSTGKNDTPTPTGTFQNGTGPGAKWHYFKKFDCWAQYAYYITGGIMFHSVLYNQKDGPVTQSSVNHLGHKASHGCIRLSVEDAKWIHDHCPSNTKIIIY